MLKCKKRRLGTSQPSLRSSLVTVCYVTSRRIGLIYAVKELYAIAPYPSRDLRTSHLEGRLLPTVLPVVHHDRARDLVVQPLPVRVP